MTNKSFFERLTGATAENTADFSVNGLDEKKSKKKLVQAKKTAKKTIKPQKMEKPEETTEPIKEEPMEKIYEDNGPEGRLVVDVYQTDSDIIIKSTIAGVKTEDLEITIVDNKITIKGVRKRDDSVYQGDYYYQEIYWGSFSREIILPVDVDADKTRASIKNGILIVKVPKIEKSRVRTIKIKTAE